MKRQSLFVIGAIVLLVAGLIGGTAAMLKHEPAFFRRAEKPAGSERETASKATHSRLLSFVTDALISRLPQWSETFDSDSLNCYLQEDFLVKIGTSEHVLCDQFHDPRLEITPGRIRLGFRYGKGLLSSIISVQARVWLVAREQNLIALELEEFRAGRLPLPTHSLIEAITEMAARNLSLEVTWYRHRSHPVALLRIQADQPRPTLQVQRLELHEGRVHIAGRSLDPGQRRTGLP